MKLVGYAFAMMAVGFCVLAGLEDDESLMTPALTAGILALLCHWYGDWRELTREKRGAKRWL